MSLQGNLISHPLPVDRDVRGAPRGLRRTQRRLLKRTQQDQVASYDAKWYRSFLPKLVDVWGLAGPKNKTWRTT